MTERLPFLPVDLTGRRVVVTAGAAGIGRAIAGGFRARGASVFICDIDGEAVAKALHEDEGLAGCAADVSEVASVEAMFGEVEAAMSGIDILVNNAGIAGPTAGITEIAPGDLRATLATDVESMFHCARFAVPHMRRAGGGTIINLGSVAGRLSFAMRTPYAAAKWGVVGFTRSLAYELGPENIRVNAILPGHVNTQRFSSVVEAKAKALGSTPERVRAEFLSVVAMRDTVEVEDIANTALFLSTPFGAAITGQAISVCKGVEMMR